MSYAFRAALWFSAYFALIILPLLAGAVAPPEVAGRGFLYELAMAFGYTGLAMMALEFSLIARVRTVAAAFGNDALLQFHQIMGYVSLLLIMAHPALIIHAGLPAGLLNPFDSAIPWMWRTGVISFWCLLALVLKGTLRRQLHIGYEWWKLAHNLLASAAVILGLIHIFMVDNFTSMTAMRFIWYGFVLLLLVIAIRYRVIRPVRMWRTPWVVARNVAETDDVRTLWLRPVGHLGFDFEPGQFAWLNTCRTPFHLEQHPISISSSAEFRPGGEAARDVAFTIKNLGDWSGEVVPKLEPGHRVWVDGPYGVFSPDREQGPGYVFIGGGVGITPLVSMCQTLIDREDARPITLFFAASKESDLAFRSTLDDLSTHGNIKIVYVVDQASGQWKGERGFISREVLQRHLPKQYHRFQFFICGPPRLMNAMEKVLPELGVPPGQVHTERFGMI
jgi:predicted ferric reductase